MNHSANRKILSLAELRDFIEKKVLVRNGEARIIGRTGENAAWMFDFRTELLNPLFLKSVAHYLSAEVASYAPFQYGGEETAAIPLLSALALNDFEEGIPRSNFYIRKSRKKIGRQELIEGRQDDSKVILIDDILSSGTSMMRQIDILEKVGKKVFAICTIIRYHDRAFYRHLTERGITIHSLFTLDDFKNLTYPLPPPPVPTPFSLVWAFRNAEPNYFYIVPKSAPVLDRKQLYFGADDGYFRALRQIDGGLVWKHHIHANAHGKKIFSSPALHDGVVFFGGYDGVVYALRTTDGSVVWKYSDSEWVASSPMLSTEHNLLYIGLEQGLSDRYGALVALDMHTGEKKWWSEMPGYVPSSPLYIQEHALVVCGCNDGVVRAFDAVTGRARWKFQTKGEVKASFAYDSIEQSVVFGSLDGSLYALNSETGELRWRVQCEAGFQSSPVIESGRMYMGGLDRKVRCIEVRTGKILWEFLTNGRIFSTPVLYKQELYIGSNDGVLYILGATDGALRGIARGTERIVNTIAINPDTERFFLPTHACEIFCFKRE